MARVIIHIGQGKTGTSSIQRQLQASREKLLEDGIFYPSPKHINETHQYLAPLILDRENVTQVTINMMGMSYEKCIETAAEERLRVLSQCYEFVPRTVIFSSESLFRCLNPNERSRLQIIADEIGKDLKILAYLRNPASQYLSQCQQRLKICREIQRPRINSLLSVLESYGSRTVGNVECRAFDRHTLLNGDVVEDFLEWINVELERGKRGRVENETMSAEAMSVLSNLGLSKVATTAREREGQRRLVREVRACDARLEGATKPVLKPEIANFITRTNSDLIELRDLYGVVFSDVDYSIVGKTRHLACPDFGSIEKICSYDKARRNVLEAEVKHRLNPSLVTRMVRRLRVQTNSTLGT